MLPIATHLFLQLLPGLLDVVGSLTLGGEVGRLPKLLQLDLDVEVVGLDLDLG